MDKQFCFTTLHPHLHIWEHDHFWLSYRFHDLEETSCFYLENFKLLIFIICVIKNWSLFSCFMMLHAWQFTLQKWSLIIKFLDILMFHLHYILVIATYLCIRIYILYRFWICAYICVCHIWVISSARNWSCSIGFTAGIKRIRTYSWSFGWLVHWTCYFIGAHGGNYGVHHGAVEVL